VSPVRYKLDIYFSEVDILHSHCRDKLSSYRIIYSFADLQMREILRKTSL
jgi:hypothetical protein